MPHDIFVTIQKLMGDAVKKQYGLTTGSRITVLWFAWFRDGLFTAVRSDDWRAVVVSSDLPELLSLADRIVVMREGTVRGEIAGGEANEERVMRLAATAGAVA